MKENRPKVVPVRLAIKSLLLIGGIALAYCTSTNAAISSGTITLNGASTASLVITEGVSIALSATFTDSAPTNNDGAVVLWGDGSTNNGVVALANLGSNITVTASHQYATATASPVTVSVTVTNVAGVTGGPNTISSSGAIVDAPLTFVPTAPPTVTEGILATNVTVLTFLDGNPLAATNSYSLTPHNSSANVFTQAYSIVSAGTSNGGALFNVQATLEYYSNLPRSNTFTITVTDTATGGNTITPTGAVLIADASLAVVSTGTLAYTEGTVGPSNEILLTFIDGNTLADVDTIPDYVAVVIWGDGTSSTFSNGVHVGTDTENIGGTNLSYGHISITNLASVASNEFAVVGEHAYPTNGTYFVTIQVNDIGGAALPVVSGIPDTVTDAGLTVVSVNQNLTHLPAFESLAQSQNNPLGVQLLTFDDTNIFAAVSPISEAPSSFYLATINWGDGTATATGTVTHVTTNEFAVYGNHTYNFACTNFPLVVKVLDLVGGAFLVSTNSAIIQAAPILGNGYDINAAANSTFNGTVASFTDPDLALTVSSFTATIDWGDGTPFTSGTIVAFGSGSYLVQGTHMYLAAPLTTETGTVTVYDNVDACAAPVRLPATTFTFTPSETGISFLSELLPTYIAVGTDVSFTTNLATFTDSSLPPGDAFDLSAAINWGDGTVSLGTITTNAANQYVVGGTHTYVDDGRYSVSVEVVDIDGNHNTLTNITIVAQSQYTDLTSSVSVLFGNVKIKQYKSSAALHHYEDFYYSQVVTLKNISGATLTGPFGLVVGTTQSDYRADWLNITGQLADGRIYVPLNVDTLKKKGTIKVTLQWSDDEQGATGPKTLPIRLIAGPGL